MYYDEFVDSSRVLVLTFPDGVLEDNVKYIPYCPVHSFHLHPSKSCSAPRL